MINLEVDDVVTIPHVKDLLKIPGAYWDEDGDISFDHNLEKPCFSEMMMRYCGEYATVIEVNDNRDVRLDIDGGLFIWPSYWFNRKKISLHNDLFRI